MLREGKGGQHGSYQEKRQYSLPVGDYSGKYSGDVPAAGKPGASIPEGDPGTGRKKFSGKFNDSSAVLDSLRAYRAGTPYQSKDSAGLCESAGGEKHRESDQPTHRSQRQRKQQQESSSEEELEDDVERELEEIREEERQKKREKRSKEKLLLGQVGKNSGSTSSGDSVSKKLTESFSKLGRK